MKIRSVLPAAAAFIALGAAGLVTPRASAQPLWDVVKVNLPYSVTLGDKTIPPGDYMIKQMEGAGDSPVLLIYNGNGMKFQTSAMTIKALDVNTPEKTELTLHHIGDRYYIDKMWVQGKNYGYQIPLPKNVREREAEAVSVAAQTTTTTDTTTTTSTTDTTAATNTETVPPQTPVEQPAPTPQPVPEPQAAPEPQPQPTTDTQPATPPPVVDNSADRAVQPSNDSPNMPATSAGWLAMLLSGGTLSGAGLMLRSRKR